MTQEIKAWFILFLSVAFFMLICLAAALGTYLQPRRWSNPSHVA